MKKVVSLILLAFVSVAQAQDSSSIPSDIKFSGTPVSKKRFTINEENRSCVGHVLRIIQADTTQRIDSHYPIRSQNKSNQDIISDKGFEYTRCMDVNSEINSIAVEDPKVREAALDKLSVALHADYDASQTCKPFSNIEVQIYDELAKEIAESPVNNTGPTNKTNFVTGDNEVVLLNSTTSIFDRYTINTYLHMENSYRRQFTYILSSATPRVSQTKLLRKAVPMNLMCWDSLTGYRKTGLNAGESYYQLKCGGNGVAANCDTLPRQKIFVYVCDENGKQTDVCKFVDVKDLKPSTFTIFVDQYGDIGLPVQSSFSKHVEGWDWWFFYEKDFYSLISTTGVYYIWNRNTNGHKVPMLVQGSN